jgi:hypothetical protein
MSLPVFLSVSLPFFRVRVLVPVLEHRHEHEIGRLLQNLDFDQINRFIASKLKSSMFDHFIAPEF